MKKQTHQMVCKIWFKSLKTNLIHLCSAVSNSLLPHELQSTKLFHPCNFPGKNTRVDCHLLLQGIFPIWIKPTSLPSPALTRRFLTSEPPRKLKKTNICAHKLPEKKLAGSTSCYVISGSLVNECFIYLFILMIQLPLMIPVYCPLSFFN